MCTPTKNAALFSQGRHFCIMTYSRSDMFLRRDHHFPRRAYSSGLERKEVYAGRPGRTVEFHRVLSRFEVIAVHEFNHLPAECIGYHQNYRPGLCKGVTDRSSAIER